MKPTYLFWNGIAVKDKHKKEYESPAGGMKLLKKNL